MRSLYGRRKTRGVWFPERSVMKAIKDKYSSAVSSDAMAQGML